MATPKLVKICKTRLLSAIDCSTQESITIIFAKNINAAALYLVSNGKIPD